MAERMTLKIVPPDGGRGELTVESAMQQVLDAFQLLSAGSPSVVWRLVSATTNSPLTIVAEADDSIEAMEQVDTLSRSLEELRAGKFPEAWKRPELQAAASSFLLRTASSLARTEFVVRDDFVISVGRDDAVQFVGEQNSVISRPSVVEISKTRKPQTGSIEGMLKEVTTFYGRPAIRIRERKSQRDIACVVSDELALTFSDHASVHDVWTKRRVTVRGTIHYGADGSIYKVDAIDVIASPIDTNTLPPLRDPDFTGGLSAAEYLEKFRAGEIG